MTFYALLVDTVQHGVIECDGPPPTFDMLPGIPPDVSIWLEVPAVDSVVTWVVDHYVVTAPTSELVAAQNAAWELVKKLRVHHQDKGFDATVGRVDSDPTSRDFMYGILQAAIVANILGTPYLREDFKLADNTLVDLDGPAAFTLGVEVEAFMAACHARGEALFALIYAATTLEDLNAIELHAGWPA